MEKKPDHYYIALAPGLEVRAEVDPDNGWLVLEFPDRAGLRALKNEVVGALNDWHPAPLGGEG
jgi:hypothetical protein